MCPGSVEHIQHNVTFSIHFPLHFRMEKVKLPAVEERVVTEWVAITCDWHTSGALFCRPVSVSSDYRNEPVDSPLVTELIK
jgi:hypothetical protein